MKLTTFRNLISNDKNEYVATCVNRRAALELVRAVNAYEAAEEIAEQLRESQAILRDIYAGKSVTGRLLDCIDSNEAALARFQEATK